MIVRVAEGSNRSHGILKYGRFQKKTASVNHHFRQNQSVVISSSSAQSREMSYNFHAWSKPNIPTTYSLCVGVSMMLVGIRVSFSPATGRTTAEGIVSGCGVVDVVDVVVAVFDSVPNAVRRCG